MKLDLYKLVSSKIKDLGIEGAAEFFDVSPLTINSWNIGKTEPKLKQIQRVVDELPDYVPEPDPEWQELKKIMPAKNWMAMVEEIRKEEEAKPKQPVQLPGDPVPAPAENWDDAPAVTPVAQNGAVTLLMPMMDGLAAETFTTLVRACKLYGMEKISIIPKWRTLIVEARNDLAQMGLKTNSEWFIFIDADGVFPCGSGALLKKIGLNLPEPKASRNFIERLMSHPSDKLIVGALYKDRRGGTRAQCERGFRSDQENSRLLALFDPASKGTDVLEENGWVGFAAVRIHRSVFEKMIEAAKPGGVLAEIAPPPGREAEPYGFFDTTRVARGEDVKFCRRAGQIGIKTWVDVGCLLGHFGARIY